MRRDLAAIERRPPLVPSDRFVTVQVAATLFGVGKLLCASLSLCGRKLLQVQAPMHLLAVERSRLDASTAPQSPIVPRVRRCAECVAPCGHSSTTNSALWFAGNASQTADGLLSLRHSRRPNATPSITAMAARNLSWVAEALRPPARGSDVATRIATQLGGSGRDRPGYSRWALGEKRPRS